MATLAKTARQQSALSRRENDVKKWKEKKDERKLSIAQTDVDNLKKKLV